MQKVQDVMEGFFTLQGTSISHQTGKRKLIDSKHALIFGGYVSSAGGYIPKIMDTWVISSVIVSWVITIVNPCKLVDKSPK